MTHGISGRLGACVLAIALSCSAAAAADLGGAPIVREQDYPPMRIERWTGLYLGATVGGAFGTADFNGLSGTGSYDHDGWVGTVLAGYNWQFGRTVVGIEADIGTGGLGGGNVVGSDLNWMGSVRGRLGFLATPSLLVYGTGGFAWANMDITGAGFGTTDSRTFTGYQVGGGLEMAFAPNWTARVEYIYTGLGAETVNTGGGFIDRIDPDFHTVRAGLTYKF
ncbi:MAG: outer membrane protein [Hyphomicrobiaceae bacterium]